MIVCALAAKPPGANVDSAPRAYRFEKAGIEVLYARDFMPRALTQEAIRMII